MSRPWISDALGATVRERAGGRCEYCQAPEIGTFFAHEPDHVIATQHRGQTTLENLALACLQCNRAKGPNIASVDPQTNRIVPLFNPRTDKWSEHFRVQGAQLIALTAVGRATAALLNDRDRAEARQNLWRAGRYPS
jgi:hypothetical protein